MASLTIRKLDPMVEEYLRLRAARHGRSMEEEVHLILRAFCDADLVGETAYILLRRPFAEFGGVEFELPPRSLPREPPDFD